MFDVKKGVLIAQEKPCPLLAPGTSACVDGTALHDWTKLRANVELPVSTDEDGRSTEGMKYERL